ncbi:MAG: hypothetical protein ACI9MR_005190 [Myxococcota bacterium]
MGHRLGLHAQYLERVDSDARAGLFGVGLTWALLANLTEGETELFPHALRVTDRHQLGVALDVTYRAAILREEPRTVFGAGPRWTWLLGTK